MDWILMPHLSCLYRPPLPRFKRINHSEDVQKMLIEIEYCGMWGYEPRAIAARDLILNTHPTAKVGLRRSGGGVFEITVDGRLAFSKKAAGRFPTDQEVAAGVAWATGSSPTSQRRLPRDGGR
jgi:selenoprotein W-related protein